MNQWPSEHVLPARQPATTVVTETAYGQASAVGTAATFAREDHTHGTPPAGSLGATDHGLISWNFAPELSGLVAAFAPTLGTVYVMKLAVPAGVITNVIVGVSASGSVLTAGQNFAGLYSSGKVLLSATADQTTAWGSTTGPQIMALTAPQTVAAGYVYVGFVSNGTTAPTLNRAGGVAAINVGLSNATAAYATGGTVQTSLPGTVTTTSFTTASIWAAVS